MTVEPVPEVFATVHNNVVSPLPAPEGITVENNVPSSYSTVYTMKATGYYSPRGRGASGLGLYYGTFAVDPTLIPVSYTHLDLSGTLVLTKEDAP